MEINSLTLLGYAIVWTVFYWFLSQYIAELSRQKWTRWVQSEESDDVLIEALAAVINEIEDRMHDKLEQFQSSFFGSVGAMVKKGKDLDPMTNIRKAAKSGDWTSMLVEYAANKSGLGQFLPSESKTGAKKGGETADSSPQLPKTIKDLMLK
jgi:hypothetical protein|tara:strand:+ start:1423 stop:1878 length:456 start_codon:yes stop_codon:yes gene_type:complete